MVPKSHLKRDMMSCILDELDNYSFMSLKPTAASGKLDMGTLGVIVRQRELSLKLGEREKPADDSI